MSDYRATLNRSQGRAGWSVIFRHPAVADVNTGKPRRVRMGLGTRDEAEARALVEQLDHLLGDEQWWSASAKPLAASRFAARAVEIFFGPMDSETGTTRELRERLLPIPTRDEGYRKILLLGTTGAGKTTVVRQLLGTDPLTERFPTTATGRTTIADTEIITADGGYSAAITFFPLDEIRQHLIDCSVRAVLAAYRKDPRAEIRRALLQHSDQRFRFNYVIGDGLQDQSNGAASSGLFAGPLALTLPAVSEPVAAMPELGAIDLDSSTQRIEECVSILISLAVEIVDPIEQDLRQRNTDDPRQLEDLIEERLDHSLRDHAKIHGVVDVLEDEIRARFDLISAGTLNKNRQGWPESWHWHTTDRQEFVREIRRFTFNAKAGFGRLLTPLVDGVRVSGPFRPTWSSDETPKLVLLDTEGLGHTQESSMSLPTKLTRLIDEVDGVVLVDSAKQPMQAAPAAALRALARSGHSRKLFLCFTHFDTVTGDNLPTEADKQIHVSNACLGVLNAVSKDLGPYAERVLTERIRRHAYFLSSIHQALVEDGESNTIPYLRVLITDLSQSGNRPKLAETRPIYDQLNLVLAIRDSVAGFQQHWNVVLGQESASDVQPAAWQTVKALSRRFAERSSDSFNGLQPVADLQRDLQDQILLFVQNPIGWVAGEPNEEDQQALFDDILERMSRRLLELSKRRIDDEKHDQWVTAYFKSGFGSTIERSKIISRDIYAEAAPVPHAAPSSTSNSFLHEVLAAVDQTWEEMDVQWRSNARHAK